ncbi:MAG: helix-turn-helix transcriptional regulator [Bauldia sp.]|nr:helix-turn-helix transcriptional regulator [Bauldia sp.]
MSDRLSLDHIVTSIYESVLDPSRLPAVIKSIQQFIGCSAASLWFGDDSNPHIFSFDIGMDQSFIDSYVEYYQHSNFITPQVRAATKQTPGPSRHLLQFQGLQHDPVFGKHEFFTDHLSKLDVGHIAMALSNDACDRRLAIVLYRTIRQEPFCRKELAALRVLLPHISRVQTLYQDSRIAVAGTIESIQSPAFVLDRQGRVVAHNLLADDLLASTDSPLRLANGIIESNCGNTNAIEAALGSALAGNDCGATIPLGLRRDAWAVTIVPTSPERAAMFNPDAGGLALAILARAVPTADGPSSLPGLSLIERQIVSLISDGWSLRQIADHRGVSYETIRSNVKRIFDKTGARTQKQLAAMAVAS